MDKNWHYLTNAQLEALFYTDSATGLTEAEAARRLRKKRNTIWYVNSAGTKKYAAKTLMDLTTLLLAAAAAASAAFGGVAAAVSIGIMLAVSRIARIAIYIWSQRILEKNARAALPRAKVVRGGSVKIIPADMIVTGDVIILDAGDTVPCDIRLTAADGVAVSESAVTDTPGIVRKSYEPMLKNGDGEIPPMLRSNMVYATGAVVSGFAIGIAVAIGSDTLAVAREGSIELSDSSDVPVLEKLSEWSRICSLSLTGAAFIITLVGVLFGSSLFQVFLPCAAMAAACLSEYLCAVGALAWARALKSSEGEVMRSAAAGEAAADTRFLVLRSTKILKSGKITLHSYYRNSNLSLMGTKGVKAPGRLLALACYCTGSTPGGSLAAGSFGLSSRYTGALDYTLVRSLWEQHGKSESDPKYTIVQHISAGSEGSEGLDNVLLAKDNSFYFAVCGRLSDVLGRSSSVRIGNEVVPLNDGERAKILDYAKNLKKRGVTLCAVGFRRSHYNSLRRLSVLQTSLCFEGFFAVSERMEEGVLDKILSFKRSGSKLIVFTDTAKCEEDKYFLEAEGVFGTEDVFISSDQCSSVKSAVPGDGSLSLICVPDGAEGIRERLRILKLCGEGEENSGKCAYIGHGVEDMWNMQAADISFAVPESASKGIPQVLRITADGMTAGEGGGFLGTFRLMEKCRHALINIRHMLKYLIVSHVARLIVLIVGAVAALPVPMLSASQVVFWGLIVDISACVAIVMSPYRDGRESLMSAASSAPDDSRQVIFPTLYGALCAAFSVASPFAAAALLRAGGREVSLTGGALLGCIFVSCIFAMPFIAAETASGKGIFSKDFVWGKAFILPFAAAAVGIIAEMFTPLGKQVSGVDFSGWFMLAFSVFPTALLVGVMSVVRALGRGRSEKNKKTDKNNIV